MTCIFCGQHGKSSSEHVIPSWTDPFLSRLPPTGERPGGKRMTHRFTPGPESEVQMREWHNDGPDLRTNAVCEECNTGWLSDLETAVAGLIGPMIVGQPTILQTEDQKATAAWAYKTVLLMQMIRPSGLRVIPTERFRQLHDNRRPPSDVRVWLARREGGNAAHDALNEVRIAGPDLAVPGFFSLLALGRIVILVAGRLVPGPERMRIGSDVDSRITVQVWPASSRPTAWPPKEPLEDLSAGTVIARL